MTTQWLYLTWYPMYLCNQTHLTNDITAYVCMKPHPLHAWTIGTLHDITSTLAENTPLILCHDTNSVYNIICIIYDFTHTVCMTNTALYLTWNTFKLTSLPFHMSSHPPFWRHHTYSVRYHRWHMYAIIWVIQDMISTLYDNLYYLWHHIYYIHSITHIIYDISSTLYDVTFTMCLTSSMTLSMASNTICFCYIHLIWHQAQCYDHKIIVCLPRHYAWHYTQCIFDIKHNITIFWKEVNVCHHSLYMYDTICTTYDITSTLYDFTPL